LTGSIAWEDSALVPLRMWAARARLAVVGVVCAAVSVAACSPSRPTTAPDPLADAIAAQLNSYTGYENVRAIIVDVDGRRRFERYFSSSADQSRSSASVTKSVMSTLVGIAIAEGRLRLDEQLSRMLPRYAPEMKPSVAKVTLRQLLTMTAGFPDTFDAVGEDELYASANWTRFILKHQDSTPGVEFHYSDYGAHLLSPILVQATGQSVLAYARAKLFDPIGIPTTPGIEPPLDTAHIPEYQQAGFAWPVDPQGFNVGAGGIKLRPRDLAAFGQLFLQAGQWNGLQVVPTTWVRQATTAEAGKAFTVQSRGAFDPQNYGYFWGVETADGATAFYALGFGGQRIEVVPQRHLVIVVSTDVDIAHPEAATVGPDDVQRLVDVIVPAVKTPAGR
jgi:CubicO group peptidase (beta-lactamase class C family)